MPKLWTETIATHRAEVRETILDAVPVLVAEGGLTKVTMSAIAERAGITRATLYKYFADADAIFGAWHERQLERNLDALRAARDTVREGESKLEAILGTYAHLVHEQHASELVALMEHSGPTTRGYQHFNAMLREVIAEDSKRGRVRDDIAPAELANFCIHALSGAHRLSSATAVRRLVALTLTGLRPEAISHTQRERPRR